MERFREPKQINEEPVNAEQFRKAPEGWMNLTEIYGKLKRSLDILKDLLYRVLDKDPNNGGLYLNKKGRVSEYFSPSVVAEVEQALKEMDEYKLPPEGWTSVNELGQKIFNTNNVTPRRIADIRAIAESFESKNPELLKKINYRGGISQYYHPELAEKIGEIIKAREAEYTSELQLPKS